MHPSIILTALTAALAFCFPLTERNAGTTLNKRGCFGDGMNWGANRNAAKDAAYKACLNGGLSSADGVTYTEDEVHFTCTNLDSTKKVDFAVELISSSSRKILVDECYDGLRSEIDNCDHGGSTSYTHWKFTSDPNAGQCA